MTTLNVSLCRYALIKAMSALSPIKIAPLRFIFTGIGGLQCLLLPRIFLTSHLQTLSPLARESLLEVAVGVTALSCGFFGIRLNQFRYYPSVNPLPLYRRQLWASLGCMALLWLGIVILITPLWEVLLDYWQYPSVPQGILLLLQNATELWPVFGVAVAAVILAPIIEEIGFRYYCYRYLKGLFRGPYCAALLTAWLFAQLHGNLRSFPGLFLFSLLLTWLYERYGNLWPAIFAHAANNALTILLTVCGSTIF
ncbi:MAG: CPBP family intramembrane metalloprotease [Verrucomicrobiota bacterium]|nr:MAG: CPBP family intramembrane metalloprotease [Verrucomicrobiota bacterium]